MSWLRGDHPTIVLLVAAASGFLGMARRRRAFGRWRGVMGTTTRPIYRTPAFLVALAVSVAIAVATGLAGNTTACVVATVMTGIVIVTHLLMTERVDSEG